MTTATKRDLIVSLASERGVIRARDAATLGVSARYLGNLVHEGVLNKIGRGTFTLVSHSPTEHHNFVIVTVQSPDCVICLLSALHFHGVGTQIPNSVWIALPNFTRPPKSVDLPLEVVHMNEGSLTSGIETHLLEGTPVRVFAAAKTISDCFKYLSSVGLDVCLEALRDALARRLVTRDDLFKYAQINRVWNTMRPYLEALS